MAEFVEGVVLEPLFMETMDELARRFGGHNRVPPQAVDGAVQMSIAVSLKRIADVLEKHLPGEVVNRVDAGDPPVLEEGL